MSMDLEVKVADQRVDCLILITFTKYFWLSAFQAYGSIIFTKSLLLDAVKWLVMASELWASELGLSV